MFLLGIPLVFGGFEYDNPNLPKLNPDTTGDYCADGICQGDLYVPGNLTVVGEYINLTVSNYNVTGDIYATGNIYSEQNMSANYFIGNGSYLTGIRTTLSVIRMSVVWMLIPECRLISKTEWSTQRIRLFLIQWLVMVSIIRLEPERIKVM